MTTLDSHSTMLNGTSMAAEVNMGILLLESRARAGGAPLPEFTRRRDIECTPGRFAYDVCSGLHHLLVEMPGNDLRDIKSASPFAQRVGVEGEAVTWADAVRHLAEWITS